MKKTFTTVVAAVVLVGATALITTRLTTSADRVSPGRNIVIPIPIRSNDSGSTTGSGSDTILHFVVTNPVGLSSGSKLVVECANKNCAGIGGAGGSGAAPGNSNVLFELTIPSDLPANTRMSLSFRPAPIAK